MPWLHKVAAASVGLSSTIACPALTHLDTIDAWTWSSDSERPVLTRVLALVAGQGRPEMSAPFFMPCIENVAADSSASSSRRIHEVAAGCVLMTSTVFSESG